MTRRLLLGFCALLVSFPLVAKAMSDKVEQISRSFEVTYPNNQKETVVVEWTATVTTTFKRHGRSSTWDHPVDDRSCSWRSDGLVTRKAYFVSHAGVQAPITDSLKVFTSVNSKARGPKNFVQAAGGYHTTCGDQMGKIQDSHKKAINEMKGVVQEVVDADAADAEANLKALLKPVKIQSKP